MTITLNSLSGKLQYLCFIYTFFFFFLRFGLSFHLEAISLSPRIA